MTRGGGRGRLVAPPPLATGPQPRGYRERVGFGHDQHHRIAGRRPLTMPRVETVIVGAGQAGLALSHELTMLGRDHVVLERGRLGERWRSERWDSLALLTPNWLNRLPGAPAIGDPGGFLSRDAFVRHLARYARSFGAPVVEETAVVSVEQGFVVRTEAREWRADNVVLATGAFDLPRVPPPAAAAPVEHLHAARYRNPDTLPPGGVLVVGSAASGQQIAAELARAGRDVTLAAGGHTRMPRRYRGRDVYEWLDAIGHLAVRVDDLPPLARRDPSLALDGRGGGASLDLGVLDRLGVRLAGRLRGFAGRDALFADDLAATARGADARMRRLLDRVDAFAGATAPEDEVAPVAVAPGPEALDLRAHGIRTIVWATGYRRAYPWLRVPVLDGDGDLIHRHGITPVPGLFAIGQQFQRRRSSHTIGGVGEDAAFLARAIAARAGDAAPTPLALAA